MSQLLPVYFQDLLYVFRQIGNNMSRYDLFEFTLEFFEILDTYINVFIKF